MRKSVLLLALICAAPAFAQDPGWSAVQSLPAGTAIKVRADHGSSTCTVVSVDEATLTCSRHGKQFSYERSDIRTIHLSARGRSIAKTAAIGAAFGAGGGAGTGAAVNAADTSSFTHVSAGKAVAVGAGVGAIVGTVAGAVVGSTRNSTGHLIYRG